MRSRLVFGVFAAVIVAELGLWGYSRATMQPSAHQHTTASSSSPSASASQSPHGGASSPSRAGASQPVLGSRWHLKLNATFSGSQLDTTLWSTCYPWANASVGCTNFANLKDGVEHEWYMASQVRVRDHALQLVAKQEPVVGHDSTGHPRTFACRSGMVSSYPGFRFQYGYVQVKAHIPARTGLWPALWLAASDLHWPPEIDLLEHWGASPKRTWLFFHPLGGPRQGHYLYLPDLAVGWHTFALKWTASRLTWYVDGHAEFSTSAHIPHQSMYFIANLAESKQPRPGFGCDGTMSIRSVRIWQRS